MKCLPEGCQSSLKHRLVDYEDDGISLRGREMMASVHEVHRQGDDGISRRGHGLRK